jgi:hypothetical protein
LYGFDLLGKGPEKSQKQNYHVFYGRPLFNKLWETLQKITVIRSQANQTKWIPRFLYSERAKKLKKCFLTHLCWRTCAGFNGNFVGNNIGQDISQEETDPMTGIREKSENVLKTSIESLYFLAIQNFLILPILTIYNALT